MTTLAGAREFLESILEDARARQDRQTERDIALRVCAVIEMEDFTEYRVLAEVAAAIEEDPRYGRGEYRGPSATHERTRRRRR